MISTDALIHLVRSDVLVHPGRREWTVQGFGMLRTYLAPNLRLHVWDPDFRVESVSDIHDHPWHFESIVLSGTIENRRYRVVDASMEKEPTHLRGNIVCGPRPSERGTRDVRPVALARWCEGVFGPGDVYRMRADELHASLPSPGAVTLIQRTPADKDPDRAYVYWPIGGEWVGAEPRAATEEEIFRITRRALECWA